MIQKTTSSNPEMFSAVLEIVDEAERAAPTRRLLARHHPQDGRVVRSSSVRVRRLRRSLRIAAVVSALVIVLALSQSSVWPVPSIVGGFACALALLVLAVWRLGVDLSPSARQRVRRFVRHDERIAIPLLAVVAAFLAASLLSSRSIVLTALGVGAFGLMVRTSMLDAPRGASHRRARRADVAWSVHLVMIVALAALAVAVVLELFADGLRDAAVADVVAVGTVLAAVVGALVKVVGASVQHRSDAVDGARSAILQVLMVLNTRDLSAADRREVSRGMAVLDRALSSRVDCFRGAYAFPLETRFYRMVLLIVGERVAVTPPVELSSMTMRRPFRDEHRYAKAAVQKLVSDPGCAPETVLRRELCRLLAALDA
ncbi:hypothetical protein [Cellulomonas sp. P5_C5]